MSDKHHDVLAMHWFAKARDHDLEPPMVYQDNTSTFMISLNEDSDYRTQHFNVRTKIVGKLVGEHQIQLKHTLGVQKIRADGMLLDHQRNAMLGDSPQGSVLSRKASLFVANEGETASSP